MRSHAPVTLSVLLACALTLSGCGVVAVRRSVPAVPAPTVAVEVAPKTAQDTVAPPVEIKYTSGPELAVQNFYAWYLEPNVGPRDYKTNPLLTADLIKRLDVPRQFDALVCAQNFPGKLTIDKADIAGNAATVTVHTHWASGVKDLKLTLKQSGDTWQIDNIACPAP